MKFKKDPDLKFNSSFIFCFLLSFATLLSACSEDRLYEKNIDLDKGQWYIDSVFSFTFKIEDISKKYNIYYNIRNSLNYPYHNLYVSYTISDAKGKALASELQNITLFDAKTGEPFGDGLGDIFSHQLLAIAKISFKKAGIYHFKLKQYMRQDPLPEVLTIGLMIQEEAK